MFKNISIIILVCCNNFVFSNSNLDTSYTLIKKPINLHLNRVNNLYFIEESNKKNKTICINKYYNGASISYLMFENRDYEQLYYFLEQIENQSKYDTLVVAKFSLYKSLVNPDFACYIDVKGNYFYYNKVLGGFYVKIVSNSLGDDFRKNRMEYIEELYDKDTSIYVDFLDESSFLFKNPPKINLNQVINSEGYLPLVSFYNSKELENLIYYDFKIKKNELKLIYIHNRNDMMELYCIYSTRVNNFLQKKVIKITKENGKEIRYSEVGLITFSGIESEFSYLSLKYNDILNFYPQLK